MLKQVLLHSTFSTYGLVSNPIQYVGNK